MSIIINKDKCIGCSCCAVICPGNLISIDDESKAYLRKSSDCWSCFACIKECPENAISFVLPPELGGKGGSFSVKRENQRTEWILTRADGSIKSIITDTREANSY